MEGRIGKDGKLYIKRDGMPVFGSVLCPLQQTTIDGKSDAQCGNWCPHFGEPYGTVPPNDGKVLDICMGKTLVFTRFTIDPFVS